MAVALLLAGCRTARQMPMPPDEASVRGFVERFMDTRLAGEPTDRFLSQQALTAYEEHRGGLWLYDENLPGGPGATYDGYDVASVAPGGEGRWGVEVRVGATWHGDAPPEEFTETLTVGPGAAASGEQVDLVVLDAARAEPPAGLPLPVALTRAAIYRAGTDLDALAELIPDPDRFTYSFGDFGDPIGYWRMIMAEGHEPVTDILSTVLHSRFTLMEDTYVWPSAYPKLPSEWTPEDREAMERIHSAEEIRQFEEFGHYLGWRVGIREDGTWLFFVAGD